MSDYLKEEPIEQYPLVLQGIKDIEYISTAEKVQYRLLEEQIRELENSQNMMTANKDAVIRYEREFNVKSGKGETLLFRRQRLLNRINLKPPYTKVFMRQKIDEIIGEGNWKAYMNAYGTILTLEASMETKEWFTEFKKTMDELIPASIEVQIKPYSKGKIEVSTSCTSATYVYGISLNGEWELGCNMPLAKISEGKAVNRMANAEGAIEESIINLSNKIEKVLVNNTVEITSFSKEYDLDKKEIKIIYDIEESIGTVTSVKILGPKNKVYQESTVYIPVEEGMEFKEIIAFADGGSK